LRILVFEGDMNYSQLSTIFHSKISKCWACISVRFRLRSVCTLFRARVSSSNCSEGQMRTYKVTRRPHYDAYATAAISRPY